jgi:hypothetical protein
MLLMRLQIRAFISVFNFKMYTFGTLHRESAQIQDTRYLFITDSQPTESKVRAIQIFALKQFDAADFLAGPR